MVNLGNSRTAREPWITSTPPSTADPTPGPDKFPENHVQNHEFLTNWESTGTALSSEERLKPEEKPPQGFFTRIWARWWPHFKRRYWWYVAGLVVLLAIFLPCFFLLVIPAIAQMMVDQANLPITSTKLLDPTPEAIEFSMVGSFSVPMSVNLDDVPIKLYRDTDQDVPPWTGITIPGMHLEGNTTLQVQGQKARIHHMDEFTKFVGQALNQKTFSLKVMGSSTVHIGALSADITLDKNIEMAGFDGLKGFHITTAQLKLPALKNGTNVIGSVVIPNPSVVSIYMGDMTLNLNVAGYNVGLCTIKDLMLKPGDNSLDFAAEISLETIIVNIIDIISKEASALAHGDIEVSASGNHSSVDGLTIPYYQEALRSLNITSKTSLIKILIDSLGGFMGGDGGGLLQLLNGLDPSLLNNLTNLLGSTDLDTSLENDAGLTPDTLSTIFKKKTLVSHALAQHAQGKFAGVNDIDAAELAKITP